MSSGLDTRPTATTLDVERLARWAWEGQNPDSALPAAIAVAA